MNNSSTVGQTAGRTEREFMLGLYAGWLRNHNHHYIQISFVSGVLSMACMMVVDFLNFGPEQALVYLPLRAALIVYLCVIRLPLLLLKHTKSRAASWYRTAVLVLQPLGVVVAYQYFLMSVPSEYHFTVFVGNLMVIFFASFLIHLFWVEHYVLNILSLVVLAAIAWRSPSFRNDALQLSICHFASVIVLALFRRRFVSGLIEKYNTLRAIAPIAVARKMAIARGGIDTEEEFKPKTRYAAFLSSDWRNYQAIASTHSAEVVASLFEAYYNIVFTTLERIVPDGTYYADWVADELSIVFYSETDNHEQVLQNAMRFAHALCTFVPSAVAAECSMQLKYDIGLACGYGVLGLQGPNQRKKTTITAEFAGTAKRLETEAKDLRALSNSPNQGPILLVDHNLHAYASAKLRDEFGSQFAPVVARTKNIMGQTFYRWQAGAALSPAPGAEAA